MLKRMKIMFLTVNAFIYAFLLVLVAIFVALQASTSATDVCDGPQILLPVAHPFVQMSCDTPYFLDGDDPNQGLKDAREGLAIFYQTVMIFIALCLALAFLIYGSMVIYTLARIRSMSKKFATLKRNKMIKVRVLLFRCLLFRSIYC